MPGNFRATVYRATSEDSMADNERPLDWDGACSIGCNDPKCESCNRLFGPWDGGPYPCGEPKPE